MPAWLTNCNHKLSNWQSKTLFPFAPHSEFESSNSLICFNSDKFVPILKSQIPLISVLAAYVRSLWWNLQQQQPKKQFSQTVITSTIINFHFSFVYFGENIRAKEYRFVYFWVVFNSFSWVVFYLLAIALILLLFYGLFSPMLFYQ